MADKLCRGCEEHPEETPHVHPDDRLDLARWLARTAAGDDDRERIIGSGRKRK